MPTASASLAFRRRESDRVVAGVAGGFADQHGLDAIVVRTALVVLTCAAGIGLALYLLGAAVTQPGPATVAPPHPHDHQRNLAVASVTLGLLVLVRATGLWLGDALMVPLVVIAAGVVLLTLSGSGPATLNDLSTGRWASYRLIGGAIILAAGLALVGLGDRVSTGVRAGAFAAALTILGVGVVLGPWLAGLAQQSAAERRERIRATEREAMAAHLHDSVLQTLALIQRTADDPRRTVTLARKQERDLRDWLYGGRSTSAATLEGEVRAMTDDVEATYDVVLDVVVVGDRTLDEGLATMVAAVREACVNAAKHSGTTDVAVFVEVRAGEVEAFVRDRGRGFDRDDAASDRRGIAQSIEARMQRIGGSAVIVSTIGEGTEVQLRLPLHAHVSSQVS